MKVYLTLSTCGFSAATDPALRFVMADLCRLLDDGAKLFTHLDDWYLYIKPHRINGSLVLISAAIRSVSLELRASKIQVWRASCLDLVHQKMLELVKPTLRVASVDLFASRETVGPVPLCLVNTHHWENLASVS